MTLKCPGLAPEVLNPVAFAALPSSKSCPLAIPGSMVYLGWLMLPVPFQPLSGADCSGACQPHGVPWPACKRVFSGCQHALTCQRGRLEVGAVLNHRPKGEDVYIPQLPCSSVRITHMSVLHSPSLCLRELEAQLPSAGASPIMSALFSSLPFPVSLPHALTRYV